MGTRGRSQAMPSIRQMAPCRALHSFTGGQRRGTRWRRAGRTRRQRDGCGAQGVRPRAGEQSCRKRRGDEACSGSRGSFLLGTGAGGPCYLATGAAAGPRAAARYSRRREDVKRSALSGQVIALSGRCSASPASLGRCLWRRQGPQNGWASRDKHLAVVRQAGRRVRDAGRLRARSGVAFWR